MKYWLKSFQNNPDMLVKWLLIGELLFSQLLLSPYILLKTLDIFEIAIVECAIVCTILIQLEVHLVLYEKVHWRWGKRKYETYKELTDTLFQQVTRGIGDHWHQDQYRSAINKILETGVPDWHVFTENGSQLQVIPHHSTDENHAYLEIICREKPEIAELFKQYLLEVRFPAEILVVTK